MKIELKPIKNDNEINLILDIYTNSFPEDERRNVESLTKELDNILFHPNIIFFREKLIGLFFFWEFSQFVYIEHFAIEKCSRSKGLGKNVLVDFINKAIKPVVLEIEKPVNESTLKRMIFYNSLGFEVIDYNYFQPPYELDKKSVEMYLLSLPSIRDAHFISHIISILYRDVYKRSC